MWKSVVLLLKLKRERAAKRGKGGGEETLLFFPAYSSLRRAHNLKTWAFNVCFMKAVVCCLFLCINKSDLAVKFGKSHGEGRELKFCTVVTSTAVRPLLIGESSDFNNQLHIYSF